MQNHITQGFRLSPQQKHLWLLQQAGQGDPYRAWCLVTIAGALEPQALMQAIDQVVGRHEILRTTFRCLRGMAIPLQVVDDQVAPAVQWHDLRDASEAEQAAGVERIVGGMRGRRFDFERGPLGAIGVITLSDQRSLLVIDLPGLCADALALTNLVREIARTYAAPSGQEPADELLQYADIAEWQNELFESEEQVVGRAFWRRPELPLYLRERLPFERPPSDPARFEPDLVEVPISPESLAGLEALAQHTRFPLSALLLACWKIMLGRLIQQPALLIGVACDGRNYQELEPTVGLLAQYLPHVSTVAGERSFRELAEETSRSLDEMQTWQEAFAWEQIAELSEATEPFWPVCFEFGQQVGPLAAGHASFSLDRYDACVDRFKLKLACTRTAGGLRIELRYNAQVISADTANILAGQLQALVASAMDSPELSADQLNLLGARDRHRIVVALNQTRVDHQRRRLVHELFEEHAARLPGHVAVRYEAQQLTYAELNTRANQLARHLRARGVGPDTPVALCLERSADMVVAILGILKAGGAYVPIDLAQPPERLTWMLRDAKVPVLLTSKEIGDRRVEIDAAEKSPISNLQSPSAVYLDADWDHIAQQPGTNLDCAATPANLAYVIYTSGSTGTPKGVAVEHGQLLNYLQAIQRRLSLPPGASFALVSTFAADLGNTVLFPALCGSGCLHVIAQDRAVDPDRLAEYLRRHPADCLKIVPSHLRALLVASEPAAIVPRRWLILGGEAAGWDLVERVRSLAPGCAILNHYGPTETTIGVLTHLIDGQADLDRAPTVPLGRPIDNTQIYILDRRLRPVAPWEPGEIYIGGANVTRGYLGRPDLTAERFIPNPFTTTDDPFDTAQGRRRPTTDPFDTVTRRQADKVTEAGDALTPSPLHPFTLSESPMISGQWSVVGGRLYRTGDRARYCTDGTIEFLGRVDDQVKIHGFRVEPAEVEAAIRQSPAVRAAAVVWEDSHQEKRLVAYVVPTQEQRTKDKEQKKEKLDSQFSILNSQFSGELRQFLRERLPDYMIPSAFVLLDALPLTANGKLDRQALPALDRSQPRTVAAYQAPRTPTEALLATIWGQVLGVERVGIHDNFFELGGDSILSIQITARANRAGLRLTPRLVFQHRTIADLAGAAGTGPAIHADQGLIFGPVPLTPIQRWFFEQHLEDPHVKVQPVLLEVPRTVDPALVELVLHQLMEHHDALRLRFILDAVGWRQINANGETATLLSAVDLSAVPAADQARAMEMALAELQAGMRLPEGPLMRGILFDLGGDQPHRLLLATHILAADAFSWRILLDDLQTAYQRLNRGEPIGLPAKTSSFQYWAECLATHAQSEELRRELDYWYGQLSAASGRLPVDHPGERNAETSGSVLTVALTPQETDALLQDVLAAHGAQINDVLLAALIQTLSPWAGAPSLIVNIAGHGRTPIFDQVDVSRTVGWFGTRYPVLLNGGDSRMAELVHGVKEQLQRVPGAGIGYGLLRYLCRDSAVAQMLGALPSAEVCFNYLGQFDQVLAGSLDFRPASEAIRPAPRSRGQRRYLLEVQSGVFGGQFQVEWLYSEAVHDRATIRRLADTFIQALRSLIDDHPAEAPRDYTPADFSLLQLDQQQLDKLLKKASRA